MKPARRLLFALAYAAAVLLFFEGAARWLLASDARLRRLGSPVDEPSWRLRWVARHSAGSARSADTAGQPLQPLRFRFDVPHPTRGWALRPGLRNLPAFRGKRLSTNSAGLRGRREPVFPKPPGTLRILVFGDSFTFGEGVGEGETYAEVLAGLLPGTEVLNFGVHGYGHDQMLIYLREAARRYQPDLVLLGYVTDDAMRNLLGFRDFAKPRFTLEEGRLVLRDSPVPTPERVLAAERRRSRFADLLTMAWQQTAWRTGRRKREMYELTQALLGEFFATARADGATPVLADLPVWHELDNPDPAPTGREQLLAGLCRERGVAYIHLRPRFVRERQSGMTLETEEHWTSAEHRIAAEGISEYLARSGLLQRR